MTRRAVAVIDRQRVEAAAAALSRRGQTRRQAGALLLLSGGSVAVASRLRRDGRRLLQRVQRAQRAQRQILAAPAQRAQRKALVAREARAETAAARRQGRSRRWCWRLQLNRPTAWVVLAAVAVAGWGGPSPPQPPPPAAPCRRRALRHLLITRHDTRRRHREACAAPQLFGVRLRPGRRSGWCARPCAPPRLRARGEARQASRAAGPC